VSEPVDSYRFLSLATKALVRAWIDREHRASRAIPWTPLRRPLSRCTLAMISTAGLALADDRPFDRERERKDPWWGDPSYRVIPRDARGTDVRVWHTHVNNAPAESDLDCAFPLRRLLELESAGEVGRSAPSHYSIMGYVLDPTVLLAESTPAMVSRMRTEGVDAVLLVPY